MEICILSASLNLHRQQNRQYIYDCLLSGRRQTMHSYMCSSAVASLSDIMLKRVVNTMNVHANSLNKGCVENRQKIVLVFHNFDS